LRLRSNSIWPAVVLHAIHNSLSWGIFERATEKNAMTAYIATEFGLGLAAAGAVIVIFFWNSRPPIVPEPIVSAP